MKKFFTVPLLLMAVAGCKNLDKTYTKDLTGSWMVYKYLLNNVDQTQQFQNQYTGFLLSFTSSGAFTEYYYNSVDTVNTNGTYNFANNYQELVLNQQVAYTIDSVVRDSTYQQQYNIFDLTGASMQLRTDTSVIYLTKNP